jgi:quercetin dioxygenase-like cupin family protein
MSKPSSSVAHALEMVPLYVLGLLEVAEALHIENLSREFPEVAEEIAKVRAVTLVLATQSPVAAPARIGQRLMTSIGAGRFEWLVPRFAKMFDLDIETSRTRLGLMDRPTSWESSMPVPVQLVHFEAGPACHGADTGLVRVPAGVTFPWHQHEGEEVTLVLEGSCRDHKGNVLQAGDVCTEQGGSAHEFTALGDKDFVYAVRVFGVTFDVIRPK